MPNPVVITRPMGQARILADRVAATGRKAVVFPLLEIQALPDSSLLLNALAELKRYAMVAFVSPNAINETFTHVTSWPSDVAIAVVGEGSRTALASHGVTSTNARIFCPVNPERMDSETLLEVLDLQWLRNKEVLIIRGESGREFLADALRANGVHVVQVAAYRRCAPQWNEAEKAELRRLLDSDNDWVITSSEAMRILVQAAQAIGGSTAVKNLQQQHFIIPHVRIKETVEGYGCKNVILTGSGDEGLLAALQCRP